MVYAPKPWYYNNNFEVFEQLAADFEKDIVKRPFSWWVCWTYGFTYVAVGLTMATLVAFMTGSVGLGCRSLLWLVLLAFSSMSWILQGVFQEPPGL
jgi:hypothetical protein